MSRCRSPPPFRCLETEQVAVLCEFLAAVHDGESRTVPPLLHTDICRDSLRAFGDATEYSSGICYETSGFCRHAALARKRPDDDRGGVDPMPSELAVMLREDSLDPFACSSFGSRQ